MSKNRRKTPVVTTPLSAVRSSVTKPWGHVKQHDKRRRDILRKKNKCVMTYAVTMIDGEREREGGREGEKDNMATRTHMEG